MEDLRIAFLHTFRKLWYAVVAAHLQFRYKVKFPFPVKFTDLLSNEQTGLVVQRICTNHSLSSYLAFTLRFMRHKLKLSVRPTQSYWSPCVAVDLTVTMGVFETTGFGFRLWFHIVTALPVSCWLTLSSYFTYSM